MATAIHVNGPAILYTGYAMIDSTHVNVPGSGSTTSLDTPGQLGISEDGVDLSIQYHDDPVIADTGGPNCPVDLQDMGQTAIIRAKLVIFDQTLLYGLRQRSGQTEGTLPATGTLISANGFDNRLIISSPTDEVFRFYHTKLRSSQETKVGTKRTIWNLSWFAWAWIGTASSAAGTVLYDHTNA